MTHTLCVYSSSIIAFLRTSNIHTTTFYIVLACRENHSTTKYGFEKRGVKRPEYLPPARKLETPVHFEKALAYSALLLREHCSNTTVKNKKRTQRTPPLPMYWRRNISSKSTAV